VTSYALEQHIRYEYPAPVDNLRQRLMVVPPARYGRQRRRTWSLTVDGPPRFRTRSRLDRFGNQTISVTAAHVPSWVEFTVTCDLVVDDDDTGTHTSVPSARDLAVTPLTAPDAGIRSIAGDVGPDPATICSRVHAAFTYEYGVTGVGTTAADALAAGRGVCQDYAHVMLSACRLLDIPARYVSGHLLGEGGSHAWVEVLRRVPGRRRHWVAEGWDPANNRRTGAGYITVATGRDYADVAPMSGAYDGVGISGTLIVTKQVRQVDVDPDLALSS